MSLITSLRGRLRGCSMKVQKYTYKTFVRPIVDFRAAIYAGICNHLTHPIRSKEQRFLRRAYGLPWRSPTTNLHQLAGIEPITARLHHLQQRFTDRCIRGEAASATTLRTRPPRINRRCFKYHYPPPPAALPQAASNLPPDLEDILENTPLCLL
ncbi:hypothetical protein CBL_05158 [Carabus blaptoides fortunei]